MKKVSKLLSLVLIGVLSISMLAGCSLFEKAPTAEELIEKPFGEEKVESADFDLVLSFDVAGKTEVEGTAMKMSMEISADVNCQYDEDTTYVAGEVEASILGMSFSEEMETYTQKDKKNVLTYTLTDGDWVVSEGEDDSDEYLGMLEIDTDIIEDLELEEIEKDDDVYTVIGKIKYEDMAEAMAMDMGDMLDSFGGDLDFDDIVYDMTATFNKETRMLESLNYVVDTKSLDNDEFEIDEMEITIKVNQINGVEVEVPSKVEKNAIEEGSNTSDGDDVIVTIPENEYPTEDESEEESEEDTTTPQKPTPSDDIVVSNDWQNGIFSVNGNKVTLGVTTVAELVDYTGYVASESYNLDTYIINANSSSYCNLDLANSGSYIYTYVSVYNPTNEALPLKDCIVTGFSQDVAECLSESAKMTVAGLTTGDTITDIEALLGTPESTSSYNNIWTYGYTYEGDKYVVIEITITDNIVTSLDISVY